MPQQRPPPGVAGTDTNPPEIVTFMRAVKSRTFFERIKGRGVRVTKPTAWRAPFAMRSGSRKPPDIEN